VLRIGRRADFDVRAWVNVRPRLDMGARMDLRARLDARAAGALARARCLVGSADGLPKRAHELEVQLCGNQICGGGDSHALRVSKSCAMSIIDSVACEESAGLSGRNCALDSRGGCAKMVRL
jgi:hypothetical protein